jgi:hypothetical protein
MKKVIMKDQVLMLGPAGDAAAAPGNISILVKSKWVLHFGDLGGCCFAQHGKNQLQVVHVIAQIFPLQMFQFFVFTRGEAESRFGNFRVQFVPTLYSVPGHAASFFECTASGHLNPLKPTRYLR